MEGLVPGAESAERESGTLAVCTSPGGAGAGDTGAGAGDAGSGDAGSGGAGSGGAGSGGAVGAGSGGAVVAVASGEDPALRAKYARECQRSTALSNELAVARRDLASCRDLVAAQEAALKHATRQRDTFEALSRRLQEWQRASQAESATQLREESKRREVVHSSAQDLLGKFEAAVKHTAALEAERQALLERDVLTQQRVASLEKALTAEHALRDMQDRVIEATRAEGEAVKAHAEDTSQRLAAAMAELTATAASAATYRSELESMGPRLTALGEDFNKSLAMQKEEFAKSIALHRAEADKVRSFAWDRPSAPPTPRLPPSYPARRSPLPLTRPPPPTAAHHRTGRQRPRRRPPLQSS